MNVNDIVTLGAKPVSFQDYFATGRLDVDIAAKVEFSMPELLGLHRQIPLKHNLFVFLLFFLGYKRYS